MTSFVNDVLRERRRQNEKAKVEKNLKTTLSSMSITQFSRMEGIPALAVLILTVLLK